MKKIIYTLVIFIIFIAILVIFGNKDNKNIVGHNTDMQPLAIKPNKLQDPQCKMTIKTQKHSAQVAFANGKTYFFDDVGCMVLWLYNQPNQNIDKKLWVFSEDTKKWIDAKKAYYKLGLHTPMHYGFGAFEKKCNNCMSFEEMKLKMLRGENLTNPKIRKKYLGI